MSRIAIVGVGAIGAVAAAGLLASGRNEVQLCVRRRFERLTVRAGSASFERAVTTFDSPDKVGARADFVLLATKAHQTAGAAPWLSALAGPRTVIAVLQNGVEHVERVTPYAGAARVLPVVVQCPAQSVEPGVIVQSAPCTLVAPDTADGGAFAALFKGSNVKVELEADFVTAAWDKLCRNVVSGAVTAITMRPNNVVRDPGVAAFARGLVRECILVGRAEGAVLPDEVAERVIAAMASSADGRGNSMYYDRCAGRMLEVEARNGAVVRFGARHGIATPLNSAATTILTAINSALA
jgi:2-dehydropantoate 2-reductase